MTALVSLAPGTRRGRLRQARRRRSPYPLPIARQSAGARTGGLRAAKPDVVGLLRWRALYAKRQREHIRRFSRSTSGRPP
jgi:hypothetical protein